MELKNQNDHVVILTSDAENAKVKKFRLKPWAVWLTVILVCVIIGALLGYIAYEEQIWKAASKRMNEKIEQYEGDIAVLEEQNEALQEQNETLQEEIDSLNSKITLLSDTITQMKASEEELTARIEKISTPTMLPITGSATIQEIKEGEPMSIFTVTEGTVIVSTASGTVSEIGEDPDYGHRMVIDHGNGYTTIYRYQSDPMVAVGDSVSQGGTLFIIKKDNTKLGYQITKDGAYVAPADMMEIKG